MDASLEALLDDTQAQLDAAYEAVTAGAVVDLSDLPPRIETICVRAIASGKPEAADRLRALIERLDTLELTLRALMATAQALEPQDHTAGRRRAAASYRIAAETTAELPQVSPPGPRDE